MKCPCKECISLAICYNKIREMEDPDVISFAVYERSCRSLRKYLKGSSRKTAHGTYKILKTRRMFGLKESKITQVMCTTLQREER